MTPYLLYALGFAAVFFLPGFLLCRLLKIRKLTFLLSVGFSYVFIAANLLVFQALRARLSSCILVSAIEANILVLAYLFNLLNRKPRFPAAAGGSRWKILYSRARRALPACLAPAALLAGAAVYLFYAGPYTEAPSDAWAHLRRIRQQEAMLRGDPNIGAFIVPDDDAPARLKAKRFMLTGPAANLFISQSRHWYFIQAALCRAAGLRPADALLPMTCATTAVFILSAYFFALFLFAGFRCSRLKKTLAAAASSAFMAAHLGVGIFAYIRYYAFAPTMLNYTLFFAAAALFLRFVSEPGWDWRQAAGIALLAFTANSVHTQEALFVYFLCLAMSAVALWRHCLSPDRPRPVSVRLKTVLAAAIAAASYAALFMAVRSKPAFDPDPRFVTPVGDVLPFLRGFFIQPPWGQFYAVLGVWGLFVYLVFVFRPSPLRKNIFMLAGMAIPLFTVFNPLTVDMMMRHSPFLMETIYRFNYCIPLHFAAGWIAIDALAGVFRRNPPGVRLLNAAIAAALVCLLLPFQFRHAANPHSRLMTLRKTPPENDLAHWSDLAAFLADVRGKTVLSDPVTSYIASGISDNNAPTSKFISSAPQYVLNSAEPGTAWLNFLENSGLPGDWLLIVNRRDGGLSLTGLAALHWPADVLAVGRHYSPEFIAYVESNPEMFRPVWKADGIGVYEVERPAGMTDDTP